MNTVRKTSKVPEAFRKRETYQYFVGLKIVMDEDECL